MRSGVWVIRYTVMCVGGLAVTVMMLLLTCDHVRQIELGRSACPAVATPSSATVSSDSNKNTGRVGAVADERKHHGSEETDSDERRHPGR